MLVLGILLLIVAAAFGLDLAATNDHPLTSDVSVLGQSLGIHSDWVLFVTGAVAGAVAMLGLSLVTGGGARSIRRRRMAKRDAELATVAAERDQLRSERDQLRTERDQLRVEHDQLRSERDQMTGEVERMRTAAPVTPVATDGHSDARTGEVDLREGRAAEKPTLAGSIFGRHSRTDDRTR